MASTADHGQRAANGGAVMSVLGAAALFGTTGTAQALGPAGATALGVGGVRLVIGALALALIAGLRRPAGPRRWANHGLVLAAGGICVAAYQLCWFAGLRRTGVALGTVVGIGSGPMFAGLVTVLCGRGLSRTWIAGTGVTVIGAGLVALRGAGSVSVDPLGLALMSGAGLSYALYTLAAEHALRGGLDAAGAMAGIFTVGAALVAPLLAAESFAWICSWRGLATSLHLGVVTIGLAYWLLGRGLTRLPASTVVTLTLAEPCVAALLGIAVLGERVDPLGLVGAALIAAGIVVTGRGEWRDRPSAEHEMA